VAGFTQWLADTSGSADVATFAQYGVLGIVASLLVWFAKNAHQRERDRADRLEEENRKLNALILDRVIPALTSAAQAAKESTELLTAVQREKAYMQQERRRHEEN
jgi:hypothetical protein